MRLSFAGPLKEDVLAMGFNYVDVHVDKPEWMRQLLIAYGQARRAQRADWWIGEMEALIDNITHDCPDVDTIVIDDVRFPNEVAWIEEQGGIVVRLARPDFRRNLPCDADESETALDDMDLITVSATNGATDYLYARTMDVIGTMDLRWED